MSACSASSRPRRGPRGVRVVSLLAAALALAAPAWARHRPPADSTTRVDVNNIDVNGLQIHTSPDGRHKVHLKGDVTVNGRHVEFNDSSDVTLPHMRHTVSIGSMPGIHIDSDDASIVRMGSDIVIDSSEVVDDAVVALFGNVTVKGHVSGDVVAVLGGVQLEPGSVVDGDAVAVGGALDQSSDATVHGQSVSLSFLPIHAGVPPMRAVAITLFAAWLLTMLTGGVLTLAFQRRLSCIAHTVSERAGWSLLFGVLLPPIAVIAGVLLMVTVIGIPLALLLPLIYLFVLWIGVTAAAYLLGCRVMSRPLGTGSTFPPVLVGTLIVGVLFGLGALLAGGHGPLYGLALFFPLLGVLLATSLSVIGSGAVIVSRFGSQPKLPAASEPPLATVAGMSAPPAPPPPPDPTTAPSMS